MLLTLRKYSSTGRQPISWLLQTKEDLTDVYSGRQINRSSGVYTKYVTCLILIVGQLEGYLLGQRSHCGRLY